ncbi:aminomethyl-transferring glycine dehydrogenase subunit GcvPB [Halobaculum sp. CBA1158]|uniref:aminomethyl-transferring glycine dehydrogenase subunit GcvPB n=1 Tax=Halobaculum sp. CBA1158 TaxID=2904243 RepID=UPI001F44883F|nr:aminomethyl-transferring glycine dehydrogenase subunit GcvPB [Halobaculum sp. CBA1158]UIP00559.1 aminomethyl-transferring glycine dehydrogenase subunit GcvPB [Halobaculum sp. CBA1158]
MNYDQARYGDDDRNESLLSEKDSTEVNPGAGSALPDDLTRDSLELPGLSEPELARHYTRLSQMNWSVEAGPYPLGSCTMKYNPSFADAVAADPNAAVHPDRDPETVQGNLEVLYGLQEYLADIGGMDAVTLQPPAGAAGEFTGIAVAKAYHEHHGNDRSEVIIPASAHGTNFATAAMAGYDVVELPSGEDGRVDVEALAAAVGDDTAALMLTNPNTVGLFERDIVEIAEIVHDAGGLLYYDGANLNALLGRARPGDMGFDIMHYNVHKTFATPHGGGGPGAGPVGVVEELAEFLPRPRVRAAQNGSDARDAAAADGGALADRDRDDGRADDGDSDAEDDGGPGYELFDPEHSIGKVHGFSGNWLVLVRAYAYIRRLGDEGLLDASAKATLNANYLASLLDMEVPYGPFHHEFAATAGDRDAADVAKGMLDYGVHPPTTKWPEFVDEAMLTEPTEVENKRSLEDLAHAFNEAVADSDEELDEAPTKTAARRVDQTSAARNPRLSWHALDDDE